MRPVRQQDSMLSKAMSSSISIDTVDTNTASFRPRSRSSTVSVHSSTIASAPALSCTFEVDAAHQAPDVEHAPRRTHLPDTSADLTRNWLTTTAPPPFSRKGVTEVVMPVKAARSLKEVPRQIGRTQSTSRAQEEEGRRSAYGRHRRAESHLQSRTSMRMQRSEEDKESYIRLAEERTLGWVTLSRGLSVNSSRRRPGLRERRNNGNAHEENDGRGSREGITGDGELGSVAVGEGDCVDGRRLRRKWPWDSFLRIVDKRLGKKGTV